jgi:hypothetical protein
MARSYTNAGNKSSRYNNSHYSTACTNADYDNSTFYNLLLAHATPNKCPHMLAGRESIPTSAE